MSARVLNPAMMPDVGRPTGGRAAPNRAALARVRRDLFGPVDHAAARALAERELRAQSLLDAERWGFDFQLEIPKANSRYEWEPVTDQDVVPEPYALRGMPYIRKHAPSTPRKQSFNRETSPTSITFNSSKNLRNNNHCNGLFDNATTLATAKTRSSSSTPTMMMTATATTTMISMPITIESAERTPPQESRVPEMGKRVLASNDGDSNESQVFLESRKKIFIVEQPTTPVIPVPPRKQSSITDFMKSRKRTLNGTTKSMIEPPEKITRNAGQIRS